MCIGCLLPPDMCEVNEWLSRVICCHARTPLSARFGPRCYTPALRFAKSFDAGTPESLVRQKMGQWHPRRSRKPVQSEQVRPARVAILRKGIRERIHSDRYNMDSVSAAGGTAVAEFRWLQHRAHEEAPAYTERIIYACCGVKAC